MGTGLVKSRLIRSGLGLASLSGTVVLFDLYGVQPRIPSSRMHLRTRYSVMPRRPSGRKHFTNRAPKRLSDSSHTRRTASRASDQSSTGQPLETQLQWPDRLTPSTLAIIATVKLPFSASMSLYLARVPALWRRRPRLF